VPEFSLKTLHIPFLRKKKERGKGEGGIIENELLTYPRKKEKKKLRKKAN